jgi:broad specificity phosphatase PhoE
VKFLFLVRHGDTKANEQGINAGPLDFPLSRRGKKSIRFLADELAKVKIDRVYASPVFRAQETAKILAKPHRLKVETLEDVTEAKLKSRLVGKKGREHILTDPDAFDETYEDLQARMVRAVEEIRATEGGNALLVSHGDPLSALLNHVVERTTGKSYYVLHPEAGSLSVIECGSTMQLLLFNYHRKPFSKY